MQQFSFFFFFLLSSCVGGFDFSLTFFLMVPVVLLLYGLQLAIFRCLAKRHYLDIFIYFFQTVYI